MSNLQAYTKLLEDYVKENPYPSYEEMETKLMQDLILYSEYGKMNHNCCKKIYENPTNKNLIVEMGKQIFTAGGIQALSANHKILKYHSPFSESTDTEIRSWGKSLEFYFMDVTPKWLA